MKKDVKSPAYYKYFVIFDRTDRNYKNIFFSFPLIDWYLFGIQMECDFTFFKKHEILIFLTRYDAIFL